MVRRWRVLLHVVLLVCVLALGALEDWYKRADFSTDAISYLDIGRAIPAREWKLVFNPLWSAGYPFLIAGARPLFPPSADGEWAALHVLNFLIYVGVYFAFLYLLGGLAAIRRESPRLSPSLLVAGCCLFLATELCVDSVARISPDLLVSGLFFVALGLVLRLFRKPGFPLALCLGLVLGCGYVVKAVFLFLSIFILMVVAAGLWRKTRGWRYPAVAAAVFALLVGLYASGLSWSYGRFTLGESGALNYAFHVNLLPRWTNWQGGPRGYGMPLHPTRRVLDRPPVFEFAEPYHNTYPPFGNVVYWYEGYHRFWSFGRQAAGIARNILYLGRILWRLPMVWALVAAALVIGFSARNKTGLLGRTMALWPVFVPAVLAIALYVPVHLEDRYLGSFLAAIGLIPVALIADVRNELPRGLVGILVGIVALGAIVTLATYDRQVFSAAFHHQDYHDNSDWRLAEYLRNSGFGPGGKVAAVGGPSASCTWAYLDGLRIVAEMGGEPYDPQHPSPDPPGTTERVFWSSGPQMQQKVLQLFKQSGAAVAVAPGKPPELQLPQWDHVPGTSWWVSRL